MRASAVRRAGWIFATAAVLLAGGATAATTYTWDGGGGDSVWTNPNNWDLDSGYPDDNTDIAVISSSSAVITVPAGLTLGELTLQGSYSGTLSLAGNLTVDNVGGASGNLTVNAGTLQTGKDVVSGITAAGTFAIGAGGTGIVRRANTTGNGAGQTITAGSMTIDGILQADGQGFDKNAGPGTGTGDTYGGSHGGRGAMWKAPFDISLIGPTYGSLTNPTSLGSGGHNGAGGGGGGAIGVAVSGAVIVEGTISADGAAGTGAGAGGSVNIAAASLAGAGTIRANGGTTASYGNGGGGRIAFSLSGSDTFSGVIQVNGGASGYNRGQAGTVYLSQQKRDHLTLGGDGNMRTLRLGTDDTMGPGMATNYVFGAVTIETNGTLEIDGNISLNVVDGKPNGAAAVLQVGTLEVKTGGLISANALGFSSSVGPGAGGYLDGGSYGGRGGQYTSVGPTYGSVINPTALGSGGHQAGGGGAIVIAASGAVTNNGTISANGSTYGAGGSVNIAASTLAGAGSIRANGAGGTYASSGGGRIAVRLTAGSDLGSVTNRTAFGGGGIVSKAGAAGTVYLEGAGQAPGGGRLWVNNNGVATASSTNVTQLPSYQGLAAYVDESAAATLIATNKGVVGLTTNVTVGDLFLYSTAMTNLYLNGWTLTVDTPYHADWGSSNLVDFSTGGQIAWKLLSPAGCVIGIR